MRRICPREMGEAMTEIEQKALALMNEVAKEMELSRYAALDINLPGHRALFRAIEQHEAFRQEVSDAVEADINKQIQYGIEPKFRTNSVRFIIPKPDPLVAVMDDFMSMDGGCLAECVEQFRVALAKRGIEVREIEK